MNIKESELRAIIREALEEKLKSDPESVKRLAAPAGLKESTDFVARREIQESIGKLVLDIEKDIIIKALDIVDLNKLDPKLQAAYLAIVHEMKKGITLSVQEAVKKLAPFPRNGQGPTPGASGGGIVK